MTNYSKELIAAAEAAGLHCFGHPASPPAPVPVKELIADIVGHLGAAVLLMPDTVEDAASLHIRQAHALVKQLRRASL